MFKNLLIILFSIFFISCQSSSTETEKPAELKKFKSEIFLEKNWSKNLFDEFPIGKVDLAFNQENIFIFSEEGKVSALDFEGKEVWTKELNIQISSGLGHGFGSLFFATENGKIISLDDRSGNKLWESNVNGEVLSSPTTNGLVVAVQSSNGKITALDFNDGSFKWEYQSSVSSLSLRGTSKPVFDKIFIYAGFGNGNLIKIESRTGVVQWEVPVTVSEGVSEIERIIDIDSVPVISSNGLAYAVSYQGDLSAIEVQQGRIIWRSAASSFKDIVFSKNKTYIIDAQDFIKSHDAIKGNTLWVSEDFKLRKLSSPKKLQDYLIFGDYEGYLHLLELDSGLVKGRFKIGNKAIKDIFIKNNSIFSLDDSGKISALQIK